MKRAYSFMVVKWLVVVFLALFLILQLYRSLYSSFATESAVYYEDYEGISITGLVIRDENLITSDAGGVMSYTIPEGGRVAKDGLVAEVYGSEAAAQAAQRTEELDAEIAELQTIQQYNDLSAADLDLLNTQIQTAFGHLLESSETGDYSGLDNHAAQLLSLLNRKQVVTGEVEGFADRIAALESEKASLGAAAPVQTIASSYAGYFISSADGYEGVLSTDMIESLTPEQLETLQPAAAPQNVVGKVVSDYEWYIAARVNFSDSLKLAEGQELTLKTSLTTMPDLPVTVKRINKSGAEDDVAVVFSCKYMNGELAGIRTQPMTIVLHTYAGLRVSSQAVRIVEQESVVDGQTVVERKRGVYVYTGGEAKFVPVQILYATEGYSICEMSGDSDGLQLYDEIIVKGKDLYDGKPLH